MELLSQHRCHGGIQAFYRHDSAMTGTSMQFGLFLPPAAERGPVPALMYLAGLTCNEETFAIKAGAQRHAAEHGLALLTPDTSPRGLELPGDKEHWDFGVGAGFYLDASVAPWSAHYRMESYLLHELLPLAGTQFPILSDRIGISGHSMGGHGALTLALRHPGRFRSLSAFAPIAAPMQCPWGQKAFRGYLGEDQAAWRGHDASELMAGLRQPYPEGILVDQGLADRFLAEQLYPERFEEACRQAGQALVLRRHAGYDHGYYFVASFVADHILHHASILKA